MHTLSDKIATYHTPKYKIVSLIHKDHLNHARKTNTRDSKQLLNKRKHKIKEQIKQEHKLKKKLVIL